MATVNETLRIEENPDGTISVYTADGHGVHGDLSLFLDEGQGILSRVRLLVRNLRTSVELSGKDSTKAAELVNASKTWTGKAVK